MQGAGNDFVLLDLRDQSLPIDAGIARSIAARKTGIGCDQVLVLYPSAEHDCLARFEVWNADGSTAEQCGNGVRCIALYLVNQGETDAGPVRLCGPVNVIETEYLGDGQVRVNMGKPEFDPQRIPLDVQQQDLHYQLDTTAGPVRFGSVSMGNPHAVIQVESIEHADLEGLGKF